MAFPKIRGVGVTVGIGIGLPVMRKGADTMQGGRHARLSVVVGVVALIYYLRRFWDWYWPSHTNAGMGFVKRVCFYTHKSAARFGISEPVGHALRIGTGIDLPA